jgi:Amt family ammonium transporter
MMCNGMLAGLVAITAPCAFVSAPVAVLIGCISGVLVIEAAVFIEKKLKIDDPVGAIAVHGCNGAFGIICVGLFANGTYGAGLNGVDGNVTGLFYGDASQLAASVVGILANIAWVAPVGFVILKVLDKVVGNRSAEEEEINGLDEPEMGVQGYAGEPGHALPPEMVPPVGAAAKVGSPVPAGVGAEPA